MRYRPILLLACCVLALENGAVATVIREPAAFGPYRTIRPASAVVIHGQQRFPAPASLYNGDGLDHSNPIFASHGSDPATLWQYPIEPSEYPVSIEFDLGADFLLGEMWIWQPKIEGEFDRAIGEFDVILKDGQGREVGVISNGSQQIKRTGIQPVARFNAFGECLFVPVPDCVRFVELRLLSNLGDPDYVALAEVAFAGRDKPIDIPEPNSLAASLIAGLLLLVHRRGRQREPVSSGF